MSKNSEHHDTYIIPPNFIEGSTLFGGMFKIRNVIEAGVLAAAEVCRYSPLTFRSPSVLSFFA